jgi:hypothetical protein
MPSSCAPHHFKEEKALQRSCIILPMCHSMSLSQVALLGMKVSEAALRALAATSAALNV